jgi:glycerophosphoryl diester phosphodiesterase
MQIFAHRGASGNYPENTASAITAALQAQVDGIELDVQSCADDFVIIHDSWLDRTTNGTGRVVDTPFSEIRKLDSGDGQQVLNLQQVLELIGTQTQINLELKHTFGLDKLVSTLEQNVADGIIEREQLLISSFDHHQLKWLKQNLPWVKIGALTASIPLNYAYFA